MTELTDKIFPGKIVNVFAKVYFDLESAQFFFLNGIWCHELKKTESPKLKWNEMSDLQFLL